MVLRRIRSVRNHDNSFSSHPNHLMRSSRTSLPTAVANYPRFDEPVDRDSGSLRVYVTAPFVQIVDRAAPLRSSDLGRRR